MIEINQNLKTSQRNRGFTLVELLLAMTGVSVLLISIATTTIQLMNLYQKGMTVKAINSAGRDIGDIIKRDGLAISGDSDVTYVDPADDSNNLGRLCLGGYSYVWNTPESLRSSDVNVGVSYNVSGARGDKIVFARVTDSAGGLCRKVSGVYPAIISTDGSMNAKELIGDRNSGLAIHKVAFERMFTDENGRSGYAISYTLGTYEDGTIDSSNQQCLAQSEATSNYEFCAINQFSEVIITERST